MFLTQAVLTTSDTALDQWFERQRRKILEGAERRRAALSVLIARRHDIESALLVVARYLYARQRLPNFWLLSTAQIHEL